MTHIFMFTWQCHNKDWFLQWDWAKEFYYKLLLKYKERFGSPKIESDGHMLNVMGYIDLNQYRVRKVIRPRQNDWSSYKYYAYGKKDPLITPSPSYFTLGNTDEERRREYRDMVEALIANKEQLNITHTISSVCEVLKKFKIIVKSASEIGW